MAMRLATIAGLLVGALGIGLLWAGGLTFPIPVPPGMLIFLAGALIVAFVPGRFTPLVGVLIGLFMAVGFFASGDGIPNIRGAHGATVAVGQVVQLVGVVVALAAGVAATRWRRPAQLRG